MMKVKFSFMKEYRMAILAGHSEIGVASTPRISTNAKVPIMKISLFFITNTVQYY